MHVLVPCDLKYIKQNLNKHQQHQQTININNNRSLQTRKLGTHGWRLSTTASTWWKVFVEKQSMSSESPSSSSSSSSSSSFSSWWNVFVERPSTNSEASSSCLIYWLSGWISINLLQLAYFFFKGSSRKSSGLQIKTAVAPSRIKKQKLLSRLVGSIIYLEQPGNCLVPAARCQNQ